MKRTHYYLGFFAALLLLPAALFAAEAPTISVGVLNASNATTTTASIGSSLHARAYVSTASTTLSVPSGTVDFTQFPNTSCTGTGITQTGVALAGGMAESSAILMPATGLSYIVHYNGQGSVFTSGNSGCVSVAPTSGFVSINTTLSTTSAQVGTIMHESATLANATANAGGSVTYSVYTNSGCSAGLIGAGTKTVTNGVVPDSNDIQFNTAGTFYWQAVYTGDANNTAATSSCANRILTISATTTPPSNPGAGSISGKSFNDVNKSRILDSGETGLAGWKINLFKNAGWWKNGKTVQTVTTNADGSYSFTGLADGTYSVEQVITNGWKQISSDYKQIVIVNGAQVTSRDFANVEKSNNNNGNGNGHDNDDRKDKWKKYFKRWHSNGWRSGSND